MIFSYTAVDSRGQRLTETLEATDLAEAQRELMQRGLFILKIEARRSHKSHAGPGQKAEERRPRGPRIRAAELLLFVREMAMMQQAGAPVVSALRAMREQPGRPVWHALLDALAERVEGGMTLHEAMAHHPHVFSGTIRSIVGAGEATGTLSESFSRLSSLLETRQRIRKRVISALSYPAALLVLATGVIIAMTTFVLPRFASLFSMLDARLPTMTQFLLAAAGWMKTGWPVAIGVPLVGAAALVMWARTPGGRRRLQCLSLKLPLVGRVVTSVILSRVLLVWAWMLRSHVSVLDAIRQTREATSHVVFLKLIDDVEQAVTEGRSISAVLRQSRVVPAPVVSAIAVGEDSGRLGESLEFVGRWMEEEANTAVTALTRMLEPAILVMMGLVVGAVCVALFLPLFDIATAGG